MTTNPTHLAAPALARRCTACAGAGTRILYGVRVGCTDCGCSGVADPLPEDLAPLSCAPTCGTCGDLGFVMEPAPVEGGWSTSRCPDCEPLPLPAAMPVVHGDYAPPLTDDDIPW